MRPPTLLVVLASVLSVSTASLASDFPEDVSCSHKFLLKQYSKAFVACSSAERVQPSYLNQVNLGVMRLMGWGVEKDVETAIHFFEKAAQIAGGDGTAEHNLAYTYSTGTFVTQNNAKASALYRRAAQLGHEGSQYNLAIGYLDGSSGSISYVNGYAWLLISQESGCKEAKDALIQLKNRFSADDRARGTLKAQELLKSLPLSRNEKTKRLLAEISEMSE